MLIFMPQSIADFEASLDAETVENLVDAMRIDSVELAVPNWEDEADIDLTQILEPQGFPTNPWNFGRMIDGGRNLDVFAKQKARIEVDRDGTRAAAVTLIGVDESVPTPVNINRPFVYMIRDRVTGVILFTGRVVAPG